MKYFEKEIPEGYERKKYINAKSVKMGIIFNLIGLVILAAVMVIAFLPLMKMGLFVEIDTMGLAAYVIESIGLTAYMVSMLVFLAGMLGYIVLHELVHGAAYKKLTGEKLTFGMSWSCAFCGVPNIYVYRKASLISSAAPLVVFSIILGALTAVLYFVSPWYYILSAFVFGLHLGGCSGDMYVILLLLFKFKDETTLIRDTGPEQSFYVKVEK